MLRSSPAAPAATRPPTRRPQRPARMSLRDLLYIFFHHKKKIILFTLLGLIGAADRLFQPPSGL